MTPLTGRLRRRYPFLTEAHALRLVRAYGTRATSLLGGAKSAQDLGRQFGATLSEVEVRYLIDNEWARSAEDVVWRRSKLGLQAFAGTDRRPGRLDAPEPAATGATVDSA